MEFNSYLFTLCFLPCVILLYFLLHKIKSPNLAKSLLLVSSLYFVSYAGVKNLGFLILSIFANFALSLILKKNREQELVSKMILFAGLVFHLGILCYTKYSYFVFSQSGKSNHKILTVESAIQKEPKKTFVQYAFTLQMTLPCNVHEH